jgi:ornithine cyclodeaminase/alanine dehydrogenase-like protein (mu-crystallin family)
MTLYLDEPKVRAHLAMADLIPAMEKAVVDFSAGRCVQPVRTAIPVESA